MATRIPLKITNIGGDAKNHIVRLSDASEMYAGMHRFISYSLLSLDQGQLIDRAWRESPIQIYQRRTRDNCLTHELFIEIGSAAFLGTIVATVGSEYLVRFIDFMWRASCGIISDQDRDKELGQQQRIEPFFEELVQTIEPHALRVHSPIQTDEQVLLNLDDRAITLNARTKSYLAENKITSRTEVFSCNITRLNLITGNGRFYCREFGYIVPFSQASEFREKPEAELLSKSLRESDQDLPSDLKLKVRRMQTSSGRLKRFIVVDAQHL